MKNIIALFAFSLGLIFVGCSGKYDNLEIDMKIQEICNTKPFTRNNYFSGQTLSEKDFQDEQEYHNGKMALHNRCLHDWGISCGLFVTPSTEYKNSVIVSSGLAIDHNGQEILVPKPILVPIETRSDEVYLVIEYKAIPKGYIPSLGIGSNAESASMQYSRIEESFNFRTLADLPNDYVSTKDLIEKSYGDDIFGYIFRNHLSCCCDDKERPIVLAKIGVNKNRIKDRDIDNVSYRKLILSPSDMVILLSNKSRKK